MTSPSDSKVPSPNPQVEPASNSSNGTSLSMASPSERRKHWTAMCAVLHIPVSAMQVEQAEMLERMVLADPAANDDDKSMVQDTLNAANYQLGMDIKAIINRLSPLPPGFPTQFNIKKLSKLPLNLLRMYFVYLQFYLRPLRISHHDLEPIFRGSKGPLVRALRALLGVPPTGVSPFH
ncbi:hypothetical protein CcaverHIS641_0105760 [Cutaneotrichosporon cavernicola]|nr:hypothetical protein CcaverHIS641_0105760 [Cutaneotrichosporon cavernicola]